MLERQYNCIPSSCTCAKGVQFYSPSRTYPAILYCTIFPFLAQHCEPGAMLELYVLLDQSHVAGGKSSSYYARFSLAVLYYVSIVIFKINGMYGAST